MNNIIFLTRDEIETFLPGERLSEAKSLMEPWVLVDPAEIADEGDWLQFLEKIGVHPSTEPFRSALCF